MQGEAASEEHEAQQHYDSQSNEEPRQRNLIPLICS